MSYNVSNSKIKTQNDVIDICNKIINESNLKFIVSKRGEKGMIIVGKDNFVKIINAHKVNNPDVTGAGDTVISSFLLLILSIMILSNCRSC